MKFTDAHTAASVCSPSRYGLLTGRSPWRLHKTGNGYRLERDRLNLASLLKSEGYRSAAIGKWHLGYSKDWNKPPITGPLELGFDYHFGVPQNHNDSTRAFIENHDIVGRKPGEEYRIVKGRKFPEGLAEPRVEDQVDTTLTGKGVEFIRRNAERPFFLYFTPCATHTHITPAAKFRGTSQAGLLGDYVQELDAHVGEILGTLDELKLTDMLSTAAEILDADLPDNAGEDSISLLPVLLGRQATPPDRRVIYIQGDTKDNAIAICAGRWKVIASKDSKGQKVHELYDLTKDPGETTNIAKEHPELVLQFEEGLAKARADGRTRH